MRKQAMCKQQNSQAGFTLIETTIALVVMMVVGLGAAGLFVHAVKYNTGATDRALAIAVAQERLETYRNLPFSDAALTKTDAAGVLENAITRGDRTFRIRRFITDESDTMKVITLEVTPQGAGDRWVRGNAVSVTTRRASPKVGPYL